MEDEEKVEGGKENYKYNPIIGGIGAGAQL
jgi:hypothetical protein